MIAGPGGAVQAIGALAVVCNRSGGSCRPQVCGKSPEEIAFAVPLWAGGCYADAPVTGADSWAVFRVRGRPPAFLAGASRPKLRRSESVQSARRAAW